MIPKHIQFLLHVALLAAAHAQTPPVLDLFTITPDTVDVSSEGQIVTLHLQASDDVAIDRFGVNLDAPGRSLGWQVGQSNRTAGTAQSGTYELEIFIPPFLPSGTLNASVAVFDNLNTIAVYSPGRLDFPQGSTTSITITNTGPVDNSPPALNSLSFDPPTLSHSDTPVTIDVTLTASDDHSGVKNGGITFFDADHNYLTQGSFTAFNRTAGDANAGTYTISVTFPSVPAGPMTLISDLRLVDHSEASELYGDLAPKTAYPSGTTPITIVDREPPILHSFTITPNPVDITTGEQTLTVQAEASDRSGVQRIAFSLVDPDRALDWSVDRFDLASGDTLSGVYQRQITIPQGLPTGEINLEVRITDTENNRATLSRDHLPFPAGSPDTITIVNTAPADTNPPSLESLHFSPAVLAPSDQPVTLTVTATVRDDLAGISNLILTVFDRGQLVLTRGFGVANRISGDQFSGTYAFEVTLPNVDANASFDTYLSIRDNSQLAVTYHPNSTPPYPDGTVLPFVSELPLDSYHVWLTGWPQLPLDSLAFDDDPDLDGFENGLEFLLGMDPTTPDPDSPNAPTAVHTTDHFGLSFVVSTANLALGPHTNANLRCEFSTDATSWTPVTEPSSMQGATLEFTVPTIGTSRRLGRIVASLP